jgi:amino acid adenylation domain-containing protein
VSAESYIQVARRGGTPHTVGRFRCAFIGQGIILLRLIELLQERGHEVVGVFLNELGPEIALQPAGIPFCTDTDQIANFLTASPIDLLFSVANKHVLHRPLIDHPRLMSINYHNGPLPAYAGLRAPAWAIFNGEPTHGITWHGIAEKIDAGEILVQRRFTLSPTETTGSLNEKCTFAAIEGFNELLDGLESFGSGMPRRKQDPSQRSYYGLKRTIPRAGIIDWSTTALQISAFVRASLWGPNTNDFGSASVLPSLTATPIPVADARIEECPFGTPPGRVLRCEGSTITVAAANGAVRLTLHDGYSNEKPRCGANLPILTTEELSSVAAAYGDTILRGHLWLPALEQVAHRKHHFDESDNGEIGSLPIRMRNGASPETCEAAFVQAVRRVLGSHAIVAVDARTREESSGVTLKRFLSQWIPLILRNECSATQLLADLRELPPFLRDIGLRRPRLAGLSGWEKRQSAYLLREMDTPDLSFLPIGSVAFAATTDPLLHYRGRHGLQVAEAIAGYMKKTNDNSGQLPPSGELQRVRQSPSNAGTSTRKPFPRDKSVVDFFREQVQERPDAPALQDGQLVMSYRDIDRLSDQVAGKLLGGGLRREENVALLLNCSRHFVVSALGVLKAGGSYLPLEVAAPPGRLQFQLSDSGAAHAITIAKYRDLLTDWSGRKYVLDGAPAGLPLADLNLPQVPSDPARRAYLIYTSGSTGRPNAVEIEHHSLTNLVCHYQRELGLTHRDRATMLAHVTFDASVADLWPCLCCGGTVLIPPQDMLLDVDGTIQWLAQERVTYSFVPTAIAEQMLRRRWPESLSLRYLLTGGDTLHGRPSEGLPFSVLNTYGPTENTVDSTWAIVAPSEGGPRPSIGQPTTNVSVYVLDEVGMPVAEGEEGELYLGGEQVARGYLNRPELTTQRFVADPFVDLAGARMYRTGDRARWNDEGELEFLGRRDLQIQLHGRRVELGEMEALLLKHPQVVEACCTAITNWGNATGIAAHVVPRARTERLIDELRGHLALELPPVLLPAKIVLHESLPRGTSGKVDRMLLKDSVATAMPGATEAEAGESLRESLSNLWCNALSLEHGAPKDATFWDLGGDSMRAVQLILRVRDLTGRQFPLSSFLVNPTLSGLQQIVEEVSRRETTPVLTFRRDGNRRPLFCLYGPWGDVGVYTHLAEALGGDQPVFGVRSPALTNGEKVAEKLEDAAATVIALIRSTTDDPEPALLGYSWGGVLAFEVARQWKCSEGKQMFVGLIGSLPPLHNVTNAIRFKHFLRWFPRAAWHILRQRSTWNKGLFRLRELARRTLTTMRPQANFEPPLPYWVNDPLSQAHLGLSNRYKPVISTPLDLHLFREESAFTTFPHPLRPLDRSYLPDCGWSEWSKRPVVVHLIDAEHKDVMRPPKVQWLADLLRKAMHDHYGTSIVRLRNDNDNCEHAANAAAHPDTAQADFSCHRSPV